MFSINISTVIGTPNAIIQKFGLQIYDIVVETISTGKQVELDFSGLKNVTTGFFHASVGNLYKQYGDEFYTLIQTKGLDTLDWREKFQDAIEIVKNPSRASEIDRAISELFKS